MTTSSARRSEAGFSLIEIIVTIAVSAILLTAVATMLFNSWKTQETVAGVTGATNNGQVIGSMIERAVRNAEFVAVDANELKVWTSFGGTALECQGFRIESAGVKVATSPRGLAPGSSLPATFPNWTPSLTVVGSGPYFSIAPDGVVTYAFDIETDGAPVRISGETQPRSVLKSGNGGCW